jgi:hypothetical protein
VTGATGVQGIIGPTGPGFSGATVLIANFTADFGTVTAQNGNAATFTISGLLTTDQVHIECVSPPPIGYQPPNTYVTAANTLSLYFNTSRACTLGSLNWRLTVTR